MLNIKKLIGLNDYTSELDQFLKNFDHNHPKLSASQRHEQEKYARIFKLRDQKDQPESKENFWDSF